MADDDFSESTLPSLEVGLQAPGARLELALTILFHPDTSRIGERCVLQQQADSWILGRNTLDFGRSSQPVRPLGDRHVSRRAVTISRDGGAVLLHRSEDSCRCRVADAELLDECKLDPATLEGGVPIMLAHSVVLLLCLSPPLMKTVLADHGLTGSGPVMNDLRRQIQQIAPSELDVLLTGETGTGKEVVASAIHQASGRRGEPMVSVNVAAIPGSLAPAALFGSARGAFTGADRAKSGYFQQAREGTLFLDEIGDAPEEVQPQLLRALQQREIQPVGGDIQRVNVRVISATDARLEAEGTSFSAALRHRLGALEVCLPPLRQHREDIGELLHHYLGEALASQGCRHLLPGETQRDIAVCASLFHQAACFHWPGNVRQLINISRQIAVASDSRLQVPPSVSAAFASSLWSPDPDDAHKDAQRAGHAASHRSIRDVGDEDFDRAMQESLYEVSAVAQRLGVSRQSVYRRMASSGSYRKASELPEPELLDAVRECGGDTLAAAQLLRISASGLRSRLRAGMSSPDQSP